MLNVPNIITLIRILLVPTYLYFMYSKIGYSNQIACMLFIVAGLTDMLDGYIARKYQLITNLGKVLDPIADKIMVTAAMIVLVDLHNLAAWVVILMLFRDFSVGALRDIVAQQGTIIAAGFWGKLKTVLQMIAIGFLIFYNDLIVYPLSKIGIVGVTTSNILPDGAFVLPVYTIGTVLIYLALFISILSGLIYFVQFRKMIE